ncbi:hypothetical protein ACFV7Q_27600 [Streptomyces sp. NPDC059851]|uniref:hypothetical protein n=1 Tax=Streptomyces sp. NPDC059851 TaxID=3346971 RepID=UPI0036672F9A
MRKLQKAALVAAMVGSLTMSGAAIAFADDPKTETETTPCTQTATQTNAATDVLGNVAQTNVAQQICSTEDDGTNSNSAAVAVTQTNTFPDTLADTKKQP